MKRYLHGFVQTVCKIRGLVLYTADCKDKRNMQQLRSCHPDWISSTVSSAVANLKVKENKVCSEK